MDALEKWMIIRLTPHQATTIQNVEIYQKLFFISSLLLTYVPQPGLGIRSFAHFWWATWAIFSWSLIFDERPERFAHIAH